MGCFLACFGRAKDRKRRRPANRSLPVDRVHESYKPLLSSPSPKRFTTEVVADGPLTELIENQEQGSFSGSKKKVTFDLNVKTYEDVLIHEEQKNTSEDDEEKVAIGEERKPKEGGGKVSPTAYPLNHRYQNCSSSDDENDNSIDEEEEEEYEVDCDFDEEDDEVGMERRDEESYDSYFSLPMEKVDPNFQEVNSPKPISASSPDREPTLLAEGNARDRSRYVHSVLNPVENRYQWKEVKARAAPSKNPNKENINAELEALVGFNSETIFKVNKPQKFIDSTPRLHYSTKQEILVDASLSNWLVSSENSTKEVPQDSNSLRSNSSLSHEDRPILGALTVEDLKQSSLTSSPRRSPSRSPDEIPILGTVGSYWNTKTKIPETKGIPNTTSKYREDKRVNWHSTPFEVRLERALNKGAAEACPSY